MPGQPYQFNWQSDPAHSGYEISNVNGRQVWRVIGSGVGQTFAPGTQNPSGGPNQWGPQPPQNGGFSGQAPEIPPNPYTPNPQGRPYNLIPTWMQPPRIPPQDFGNPYVPPGDIGMPSDGFQNQGPQPFGWLHTGSGAWYNPQSRQYSQHPFGNGVGGQAPSPIGNPYTPPSGV